MISRFLPPAYLVFLYGLIALGPTTAEAAGIGVHLRVHAQNIPRAVAGGHNPHVGVRAGALATESGHKKYSARYGGRKYGDEIAQMSDRRERFTSIGSASRSEVKIALRLQLGDPPPLSGNKARQQILQRNILRLHGVAAGSSAHSCKSARSTRKILSSAPATKSLLASSSGLLRSQILIRSSRISAALSSFIATSMPPPSQSTPQPSRISSRISSRTSSRISPPVFSSAT